MLSRVIQWAVVIGFEAWALARLVVSQDATDWFRERVERRFPTPLPLREEVAPGQAEWRQSSIRDMRHLHRTARDLPKEGSTAATTWALSAVLEGRRHRAALPTLGVARASRGVHAVRVSVDHRSKRRGSIPARKRAAT